MEENVKESENRFEGMDINADADVPGNTHLSNDTLDDGELIRLNAQLEEQKEKFLRLAAEFENYKRRTAREKSELVLTAGKDVIVPLVEVLDDIDRAEEQMANATDLEQLKEGTNLIFQKFRNTLYQRGLKPMESISTPFDMDKHDAIQEIDAGKENSGKVVQELEKGYLLNDRIIRYAKVIVGK